MKVFKDDKERIKEAVTEEVQNYCGMLDCTIEPHCLHYESVRYGIRVIIDAEES